MTKKKSILTLIFSICFIIPAMFMLTACGHNHKAVVEWSLDDTYHWHVCEGENCEEQLDKAEHTWGEWAIATESTCSENGKEERVCTVCGKKASRTIEVAQHEYTYVYDAQTCTFISPTKETEGKLLLKCNNCDHKEEIFVYPVVSEENYTESYNYSNGWKYLYRLKNEFYTKNSISNEIKTMTQKSETRVYLDIEVCEESSGCRLVELIESETSDELFFNYEFTEAGRYYIALRDSSTTKAFKSITFNPADGKAVVSSLSVYNVSGAQPTDDSAEANIFAFTSTYVSNSVKSSGEFLIVVDVQTAGAGTFTMEVGKATATLSINDLNKVYDGQDIEDVYSTNSTATAVVEYKVQGADDSTYTTEMPYNAGNYTVRVSIPENEIYTEVSATRDFTISTKTLVFSTNEITKEYDGKSNYTYKFTEADGLVGEDECTFSFTITDQVAGTYVNAGSYNDITGENESVSNSNYTVDTTLSNIFGDGQGTTLTITKKVLSSIELETSSNAIAQTITLTTENGIVDGDTVKVNITVNNSHDYEQEGTLNLTTNEPSQGNAQIEFVKDGDYENYDFDTTNIGTITYTTA